MARPLVSDELWELIEPLIPKVPRRLPVPGSEADRRPEGADGDPVRVADGDPVGVPAAGDGLRLGDDLLAPVAGVAAGWRLAAAARAAAGEAARGRSDRLVAGGDRQLARAGLWGGEKTGPSPVDRARSGSKHHLIACGRGTPARLLAHRRQPQRHHPDAAAGRRDPARARQPRPPRRRPQQLLGDRAYHSRARPPRAAPPRHPGEDRLAQERARLRARQASAGSSSARSPGCTSTAACASATSAATTSTKPSSRSPAA